MYSMLYSVKIIASFDKVKQTALYPLLKELPKGVLHHLHFDCCEDEEFVSCGSDSVFPMYCQ